MSALKNATCNTCTLRLVTIAYRRAPWFWLLREPLKLGMKALSRLHRVNPAEYAVRTPACYNCVRFYKVALGEKSATFRWLHRWANPAFDYFLERIVTGEELAAAKAYARAASTGEIDQKHPGEWMRGMKTGL